MDDTDALWETILRTAAHCSTLQGDARLLELERALLEKCQDPKFETDLPERYETIGLLRAYRRHAVCLALKANINSAEQDVKPLNPSDKTRTGWDCCGDTRTPPYANITHMSRCVLPTQHRDSAAPPRAGLAFGGCHGQQ